MKYLWFGGLILDMLFLMIALLVGTLAIITEFINIFNDDHKLYITGNTLIVIDTISFSIYGMTINALMGGIIISILFILSILAVRGANKGVRLLIKKNKQNAIELEKSPSKVEPQRISSSINDTDKYKAPSIHEMKGKLYNYIVLDIETTGLSKKKDEITQISAIKFKDDKEVERLDQLLNPQKKIPEDIQYLTHITNEMVKDKPIFKEFNDELSKFIGQSPIVGHNVKFDIGFLIQNKINLEDIFYQDTLPISQIKLPYLDNHKLTTLKKYFGVNNVSHNALNDCETTAIVYQHLRDNQLERNISDVKTKQYHEFDGLRFCITGQFMEMTRDEIKELINIHGGRVTSSVSGLTDYLIKGKQITKNLTDGIHSISELKAMNLSDNGGKIKIIDLNDLKQMIGDE